MKQAIGLLLSGQSLSRSQASSALDQALDGPATPEQIAALLIALRMKEESVPEILGFLDSLRKRAVYFPLNATNMPKLKDAIDVCGTGGDLRGTFNISTTVAFVVAAAGQAVAKHGNRSVSSRSGSFDVLEALGLPIEEDPARLSDSMEQFGLGLFFAQNFHPSLRKLAPIRKNLGFHTVLNALGPLLNPAQVRRQLIGVYSPLLLEKMALALHTLGSEEAMIVRGEDGMDELSLSGPSQVCHLKDGVLRNYTVIPEDAGLGRAPIEALRGGDAAENAKIMISILKGERGPKRDVVLLNAAAALMVGGKARDFKEGARIASESIESGRALSLLKKMSRIGVAA